MAALHSDRLTEVKFGRQEAGSGEQNYRIELSRLLISVF
jgi:hypothetical protein